MRARAVFAAVTTALFGCAGILGVPDLTYDPTATAGNPDATASSSSSGGPDGSTAGDAAADGASCNADLQTDGKNCGRCGRDCAGATCTAGACEAQIVAQGLTGPTGLALSDTHVYFTEFDSTNVSRVAKGGSTVEPMTTTADSPVGVAVDGNALYWANFAGTNGGVFRCDPSSCAATTKKISATGYDRFVVVRNGQIFFTTESDVRRMLPDGGAEVAIGSATQPFDLAVDDEHVYFSSNQTQLQRTQVDGGAQTDVGPLTSATNTSFVAVDNERFYWAFVDQGTMKGQVLSGQKAAPATRVAYGTNNEGSLGVAADDTYVYFANGGTFMGATPAGNGQLLACHKTGCTAGEPIVLAKALKGSGPVRTDATHVYWNEYGGGAAGSGRVRRVVKP